MPEIGFYHCTRRPAAEVAVQLAGKTYESGARLLIAADAALLADVDAALWTLSPSSFLPHAVAGGARDADQPILLAEAGGDAVANPANGATFLMVVNAPLPDLPARFARIFAVFDDGGPAHAAARTSWKSLAEKEDMRRIYWQQTEKGWRKAQEG